MKHQDILDVQSYKRDGYTSKQAKNIMMQHKVFAAKKRQGLSEKEALSHIQNISDTDLAAEYRQLLRTGGGVISYIK
jgi:glycine cleavage system protein P-like pyridoxal-binding family